MIRWLVLSVFAFGIGCVPEIEVPGPSDSGGSSGPSASDADGDGYGFDDDCDDENAWVFPGAPELCDGLDNDCDDEIDEELPTLYVDVDSDGFGNPDGDTTTACEADGYSPFGSDCDDFNDAVFPGAEEICDEVDNNCDGETDEGMEESVWYIDEDGDGYGDPDGDSINYCGDPDGYSAYGTDCDDTNVDVNPDAYDSCDGFDNDCDDLVDEDEGATVSVSDNSADYDSISDAINSGAQCISVGPGTYYEAIDFGGDDLVISSSEGPETTIIDGRYEEDSIVRFTNYETNAALLSGFTIQNGNGYTSSSSSTYSQHYGGCIYISSATPTLEKLIVQGCQLPDYVNTDGVFTNSYGGGLYARPYSASDEQLVVKDVEFTDNRAGMGADIYIQGGYSESLFQRIWAHDSYTTNTGAIYLINDGPTHTFQNLILSGQSSETFQAVFSSMYSTVLIENATIVDNSGFTGVYQYGNATATDANMTIRNSFIGYSDAETAVEAFNVSSTTFAIQYAALAEPSDTYFDGSGTTGEAHISTSTCIIGEDPRFNDISGDNDGSNDDLRLDSGSPLIDAGDSSSAYYDTDGSRNDIGAYGGPYATW